MPTPARKRRTLLVASAAAALTLAACGQSENMDDQGGGGGDDDGGPVELRFTWWGADARAELTEEVVTLFEEKHPDIDIQTQWSSWESYWDRLSTGTAAADMPDIIQMDESQIATYGSQGTLLDLQSVDSLDLSGMEDNVLSTGEVDGTLYGAPVGIALHAIAYNPEILEQAGIEVPDDTTWTWDEFYELAGQAHDELGDQGVYGIDFWSLQSANLQNVARQKGEEVFPREDETPISRETIVEFFEQNLELMETGAVPPGDLQIEGVGLSLEQSPFAVNETAFHPLWHTQVQAYVDASGVQMGLLRQPALEPGEHHMVNKASMYWSIAQNTQHPEEAATFVDFLLNDEEAARVLGVERGVPAIPAIQEVIEPELGPTGQMSVQFAADLQDEVVPPPQVTPSGASTWSDDYQRIAGEVLFRDSTPEEAADELLTIIEGYQE
ncbi:extracellular solute-binding protein [Georgenia halophila]|uniref:Extracellular solute-binding protein n=1 Tax=Georgenia halophila TaxID=620889 RepID=A0ABP8LGP7_9MICO